MMIMGDRKKLANVILGPDGNRPEETAEKVDHMETIAQELIDAVHSKDVQGVKDALHAAVSCASSPDSQDPS